MVACAVGEQCASGQGANDRRGITWIRVFRVDNGAEYPERRSAFVPVLCQQCGEARPVRQCVSAAGRGRRPGHRHRRPDARALPGLPLLHGGLPVSCALLQLVGSEMAGGYGEDPESRVSRLACAGWWRSAISATAAACRHSSARPRKGSRKSTRPTTFRPALKPAPAGAIRFGDLNDSASETAQEARAPRSLPSAGETAYRSQDLLPISPRLGA